MNLNSFPLPVTATERADMTLDSNDHEVKYHLAWCTVTRSIFNSLPTRLCFLFGLIFSGPRLTWLVFVRQCRWIPWSVMRANQCLSALLYWGSMSVWYIRAIEHPYEWRTSAGRSKILTTTPWSTNHERRQRYLPRSWQRSNATLSCSENAHGSDDRLGRNNHIITHQSAGMTYSIKCVYRTLHHLQSTRRTRLRDGAFQRDIRRWKGGDIAAWRCAIRVSIAAPLKRLIPVDDHVW